MPRQQLGGQILCFQTAKQCRPGIPVGKVGSKAFGIQIKPITANSNFGNYKITDRMSGSFQDFEEKFGGKVFVIFSARTGNKKDIVNKDIIKEIGKEIKRLKVTIQRK